MDVRRHTPFVAVPAESWLGELNFEVAPVAGRSRITHLSHFGPLRIQRPFYPESDGTAHVYLLHPPGGVVGGDHLRISSRICEGASALMTTPSATKLYRSSGSTSVIETRHTVESGACLEWLPQETIAFDGSLGQIHTVVDLEGEASYFGWEVVCLGRPAAGEDLTFGALTQTLELYRDGTPIVVEKLVISAEAVVRQASWGLGGAHVVGTFVLTRPRAGALAQIRRLLGQRRGDDELFDVQPEGRNSSRWAATELEGALVVRYLGRSVPECHDLFRGIWEGVRPELLGKAAVAPRIWRV